MKRSPSFYFGLLPVLLLFAFIIGEYLFPSPVRVYEPTFLLPTLNTALFLAACVIAYIARRIYLITGSVTLLWIGCGVLTLALGALTAGWLIIPFGPNVNVTIFNLGAFLASICHIGAVVASLQGQPGEGDPSRRKRHARRGYEAVLLGMTLLVVLTVTGHIPPFFIQGQGPTVLRQNVAGWAVVLFAVSCLFTMNRFRRRKASFLYWYSLALALLALAMLAFLLQPAVGSPIGWLGRSSYVLAAVYFLISVYAGLREASMPGANLNQVLTELFGPQQYRALFDNLNDAMAIDELLYDDQGKPCDWRILDVNPAYLRDTGRSRSDIVGRRLSEIFGIDRAPEPFLSRFAQVVQTGEPVQVEGYFEPLQMQMLISAFHLGGSRFATVTTDITERKRAEEALRESEEHYRSLFEHMLDGFAYCQMQFEQNQPVDFIYLKVNEAFETLTGLKNVTGKKVSEVIPGIREANPEVFEIYGRVALTGRPERFETYLEPLQKWLSISVYSPHQGYFVAVFDVITERKQAEAAQRQSNQRLDLLAETASRLLASVAPQEVVDGICRKVMEFLHCEFFFNFLVDDQEGRLHLNAYGGFPAEEARRNEWHDFGEGVCGWAARDRCRVVAEDILNTADARMELVKSYGIQAYACHPLLVEGRLLGTLSFGTRTRPSFTAEELALMNAVADQVAIAMDRKLAEEALRTSEARERSRAAELQAVLDAMPTPIFMAQDPEAHQITGNPAAYELLDLPPGSNLSKTATEDQMPSYKAVKDGRELEVQELPVHRAVAGQTVRDLEYDLVLADGAIRHVSANAVPLLDEFGRPRGAVAALADLTQRQEAEEALKRAYDSLEHRVQERTAELKTANEQLLREVEERHQAEKQSESLGRLYRLLSKVNEMIVRAREPEWLFQQACRIMMEEGDFLLCWIGRVDWEARVVRAAAQFDVGNDYPQNITISIEDVPEGRGPSGVAVREGRWDVCLDIASDPRMAPWRNQALARGFRSSAAFPLFVGGKVAGVLTLYSGQTGFFNQEEVGLLTSLAQDLSFAMESMEREAGRRQAEAEIRRLNEELEQRVKERTAELEFANRELESFSYSVSHDLKAPIRAIQGFSRMLAGEHAARLDEEALRLLDVIVDNTQTMAKLIDDLLALARLGRQRIRKSAIDLAALAMEVFGQLREQEPERNLQLTMPDLPQAWGDPALIKQVVMNLLDNAIKYTRTRKTATIEVGGYTRDGDTVYYVKDNGVGFDKRYAQKLFGVFQRLHGGSEYEGTGVGLAIVQRIIQRHGGRVWAESKVGEGATFYFTLPQ